MLVFYKTKELQRFVDNFTAAAPKHKGLMVHLLHSENIPTPPIIWALKAYSINEPAHFIQEFGGRIYDQIKALQFLDNYGKPVPVTPGKEPQIFGVLK